MSESYGQFASVYDQLMTDMPYDKWLSFVEAVWEKHGAPQRIVDLGCGTGNVGIPLAERGYHIVGIDLSQEMLRLASNKWRNSEPEAKGSLTLLAQNMCDWEYEHEADSVISLCDSINYVVDEDKLLTLFHTTYMQLKQGGTFIFDVHPISKFEQYASEQPFVYDDQGIAYLWTSSYDEEEHIIEHELAIFVEDPDGRYTRIDELHLQRAYHHRWLESALREVGFTQVHAYADFEFEDISDQSERLFFVAIK